MAEAGVTTSHRRSRMRRRAARTAVAGTRASVSVLDAVRVVKGFSVSVRVDDEDQEFVVVGADIAQAAAQAIDSLASRGIEGHVSRICYLADALTN